MFTEKAHEKFEKWLISNADIQDLKNKDIEMHHWLSFKGFKNLPQSLQWGVIQDFADSLNLVVELEPNFYDFQIWIWNRNKKEACFDKLVRFDFEGTRQQARTAAINKLNQLINEI